jgi:zinc protease
MGGARETMAAIGSAIAEIIEYKLPDDYWDTFGEKVSGLTELQVNGAAKTLIQPQKTVWVIVGDRASIEADIKSLNIGPIHHVDADGKPVE